jgi:uncharacterized membrane protein
VKSTLVNLFRDRTWNALTPGASSSATSSGAFLLTVPITVIGVVLWKALVFLDTIIPYDIPGLGLLTLLGSVTLIGWIGSTVLLPTLCRLRQRGAPAHPVLKTIYDALKDLVEALVGSKRKFDRPVLVRMVQGSNLEKLGFHHAGRPVHPRHPGRRWRYTCPTASPGAATSTSCPAENVTPLNARAGDVMKFIVSGGVAHVDDEEHFDTGPARSLSCGPIEPIVHAHPILSLSLLAAAQPLAPQTQVQQIHLRLQ